MLEPVAPVGFSTVRTTALLDTVGVVGETYVTGLAAAQEVPQPVYRAADCLSRREIYLGRPKSTASPPHVRSTRLENESESSKTLPFLLTFALIRSAS